MSTEGQWQCYVRGTPREITVALGIILLASMLACAPMLWYGASNGFDSSTALVWQREFSRQLIHGDLYPRWLMDANRGAGSPAFYFYAPLPYYFASVAAGLVPAARDVVQLAWADWLLLALSGVTFYLYGRVQFKSHLALTCSLLYMLLPYHYEIDLWTRQDLGELTNYIWMPLVLRFGENLLRNGDGELRLATCYGLMLISHLPSTILFTLCLLPYILSYCRQRAFLGRVLRVGRAAGTAVLLASIYWIPAYFCQRYIHAEAWWSWFTDFHLWFFPVRPLEAFRNIPEGRTFNLRVLQVVSITTAALVLFTGTSLLSHGVGCLRKLGGYLGTAMFAWFLMTPASTLIWEATPLLAKVQFPYRLSMIIDLATAVIALHSMSGIRGMKLSVVPGVLAAFGLLTWCVYTADLKTKLGPFSDPSLIAARDANVHNGVDAPEYTTVWSPFSADAFDNSVHIGDRSRISYDLRSGLVQARSWSPGYIKLKVDLTSTTLLVIRQFYFPGWQASTPDGQPMALFPSREEGLISLSLPSGRYQVIVKLVALPEEIVGWLMSLLGIGVLCLIFNRSARESRANNVGLEGDVA